MLSVEMTKAGCTKCRFGNCRRPPRFAFLASMLAAIVGVTIARAQPLSDLALVEEERARTEWETQQNLEAQRKYRSARAHSRMRSTAATVDPQGFCPAFGVSDVSKSEYGRKFTLPFEARFAPRPPRPPWRGIVSATQSLGSLFNGFISGPVVQGKCVNCHVEGGVSGHTRLVFAPAVADDHEGRNLAAFEHFVATVDDASDLILNKIQGVAHGGGIQVPAGTVDFSNMETFLRLLGGETSSGSLSPDTLFDGVTMASPAKTLRRAALMFAGRLPTQAELNSVNNASDSRLRQAIRNVMTGPGFHQFLIRASNDRLLTDKFIEHVNNLTAETFYPELNNMIWEARKAAIDRGYKIHYEDPEYRKVEPPMHFGIARAPLEMIAYVVQNELPYTEVLTANYIMANPLSARAYGALDRFENPDNFGEFRPTKIASYYRIDDSKIVEDDSIFGPRVINPGNLATDYPHAGILNTMAFLQRYPTTATNRNRARSRWTYYHFLGLDIEKSAARTTDPVALADTDNPTMKNPACTVCHSIMDPVAGAFQNYDDVGFYKSNYRGLDSLAGIYKYPKDGTESLYQFGDTWYRDMRVPGFGEETAPNSDNSLQWLAQRIAADERFAEATVKFWWPAVMGVKVMSPPEDQRDPNFEGQLLASLAQAGEVGRLADGFRQGFAGGRHYNVKDLLTEIALSPWFRAESVAGTDPVRDCSAPRRWRGTPH